ncbi:MAG: hypothetical protein U0103_11640 [Candidatus Obscuribacterales bacterium]
MRRRLPGLEVLAGEKANNETKEWLPNDTIEALKEFGVGIKGPLICQYPLAVVSAA